jgi:hypothetical protein
MANIVPHLSDRQTAYSLRMFKCTPLIENGVQVDNLVRFAVDRPFILLHAFVVRETDERDRYSDLSQGLTNALLYLDNHPVVQVVQVANITAFHISAGEYLVEDLRPSDGEVDINGDIQSREDWQQYVFVLLCTNF